MERPTHEVKWEAVTDAVHAVSINGDVFVRNGKIIPRLLPETAERPASKVDLCLNMYLRASKAEQDMIWKEVCRRQEAARQARLKAALAALDKSETAGE